METVVRNHVQLWLTEEVKTPTAAAINGGFCADFRDGLFSAMKAVAELADLDWQDLCYSDLDLDEERPEPPPGLDWVLLGRDTRNEAGKPIGRLNYCCHEWVRLDGLHFDSEAPEGVSNPFEVPCIRRGLTAALAAQQPGLLTQLVHHSWWQLSVDMTIKQLQWQIESDEDQDSGCRQALQILEVIYNARPQRATSLGM